MNINEIFYTDEYLTQYPLKLSVDFSTWYVNLLYERLNATNSGDGGVPGRISLG